MLRRIGVVVSVGLADSISPTTIGPGLYLATGGRRVWRVAQFTLGLVAVNLPAGLVLTIGPGRLLLDLVPRPNGTLRDVIELVAGIVLIAAAAGVWLARRPLGRRDLPMGGGGGSSFLAGVSIAALELPTAAPYFAVIAAIDAATDNIGEQVGLLVLYNVAFILPLLAIIALLLVAGDGADPWLQRGGAWLQRRWPVVLSGLLMVVGGVLTVLGGVGLLAL